MNCHLQVQYSAGINSNNPAIYFISHQRAPAVAIGWSPPTCVVTRAKSVPAARKLLQEVRQDLQVSSSLWCILMSFTGHSFSRFR
jgi:hypothetical protein